MNPFRCPRRGRPSAEAAEALRRARRTELDARGQSQRADEIAADLAETRRRNHFAAAVARAIRGD